MLSYVKSINSIWGKGTAEVIPHKDINAETLDKWYDVILNSRDLVDTSEVISLVYQQCNKSDFEVFMEVWIRYHDSRDTAYITKVNDDYYGDIIIIGFEKGITDITYYCFEVK